MPKIKERIICVNPRVTQFYPKGKSRGIMQLSLDVLEAMRWVDVEGLSQDEAAKRLNISRGTLQRMLYEGHQKVTEALIYGYEISIHSEEYAVIRNTCSEDCHCLYKIEREKLNESKNRTEV